MTGTELTLIQLSATNAGEGAAAWRRSNHGELQPIKMRRQGKRPADVHDMARHMSGARAVVVLNGPFRMTSALSRAFEGAFVVAADGGFRRLGRLGRMPDVVVGDFDSVRPPSGVDVLVYPAEKDETDGELAVQRALAAGALQVTIVGAMGGRHDMAVGHVALLRQARSRGAAAVLTDGRQAAFLARRRKFPVGPRGRSLSVIALTREARFASYGLRWPLDDVRIRWDEMRGLSNLVVADDAWIRLVSGEALCVAPYPLADGDHDRALDPGRP